MHQHFPSRWSSTNFHSVPSNSSHTYKLFLHLPLLLPFILRAFLSLVEGGERTALLTPQRQAFINWDLVASRRRTILSNTMDTMYDPPSGLNYGGSKSNKNILQYKYDESVGRVRRVSSQERTTFFGVKKRFAYVGLGVFILAGAIVGVFSV